jgi:inorganic pyrophosphatase
MRWCRYGPSRGNYGGLPQTWSNSNISDTVTGSPGDNDPLDVLDISSIRAPIGGVYKVKVRLEAFRSIGDIIGITHVMGGSRG